MATRDVELVIKARDQATAVANAVTTALNNLAKAEDNLASKGTATSSVLSRLQSELTALQATASGLGGFSKVAAQFDRASISVAKMEANLARAQVALTTAAANSNTTAAKIATLQARVDAAATSLDKQKNALGELATQATAAGTALGGVATDQKAIQVASESTADAIARVAAAIAQERAALAGGGGGAQVGQAQAATAAYRAQAASLQQLKAAHEAARLEANRLGAQMAQTKNPTQALRTEFALAAAASAKAKNDFIAAGAAMSSLKGSAEGGLAAFTRFADAEVKAGNAARAMATGLGQAKAQAAALNASLVKNLPPLQQTTVNITKAQAALKRANAANTADVGFLGLTPNKLQNLSFQINDVITQLASGTSIQQTIGQQAAQIGQLFPSFNNILISALRLLPVLALIGAALSPFIAAFLQLTGQANALRDFNKQVSVMGENATASGQQLTDAAVALDRYGASLDDAVAATKTFNTAGIAADQLERLNKQALDLSAVLGIKVPEAAQLLARAINSGTDGARELDEQLNFLTDTERKQIAILSASTDETTRAGRESEARRIIADALTRTLDGQAEKARGPWSKAFRDLGGAFRSLVDAIQDTGAIQSLGRFFDALANSLAAAGRGITQVINGIRGIDKAAGGTGAAGGAAGAASGGDPQDANSGQASRDFAERFKKQQLFNESLKEQNQRKREEIALTKLGKSERAGEQAVLDAQREAKRAGATLDKTTIENTRQLAVQLSRANESVKQGTSELKRRANAQREFNAALDATNAKRLLEASLAGQTQRDAAIRQAVEQAQIRAEQQGAVLSDARRKQTEDAAAAEFDAVKAQENKNLLLEAEIQKRALLNQTVSIQQQVIEQAQLQSIDLTQDYGVAWANARTEVLETEAAVKRFTDAQQNVSSLAREMADKVRDFKQATTDGASRDALILLEEEILLLQEKLIAAKNEAVSLGTALGPGFEAATRSVEATRDQIGSLTTEIITAKQVNDRLAEGLSTGFVNAGVELGKVIDGTQSWGDALSNIGDLFRQFAADFLMEIAKMIAKQAILNALQGSGGQGGTGGVIAGAINALFAHGGDRHVGQGGVRRKVDPRVLIGARRLHSGTAAVGLRRDEVPAILQRGEGVISREQNKRGGGLGGGGATKIVNAFDGTDFLNQAMSSKAGERIVLNFVKANRSAFQAALQN